MRLVLSNHYVIQDRQSGHQIIIEYPVSSLTMDGFSLSIPTDPLSGLSNQYKLLIQCLIILQFLPEKALEEAAQELAEIYKFSLSCEPADQPTKGVQTVTGTLREPQTRPSIVLDY
ncbi:hypothetical protein [Spirulina subsalsa]|uniref:hypothetical protein n=1 Tax=Spirulina subsalsa TaxID=54311 RepID=UPI0002FC7CD7|nr:hypothetical protein [Spirulina subsalsa]